MPLGDRDAAYLFDMFQAAQKVQAQRNVLIHEYEAIEDEEIWEVATAHIPHLIRTLSPLIPPLPPEVED